MGIYKIKIIAKSSLLLATNKSDITIDTQVIHDQYGMPYFPAKRFKGLLYESALEMAENRQKKWITIKEIDELFGISDSESNIRMENFYLPNYEQMCKDWQYLNNQYKGIFTKQSVLELYTDIRFQTAIDKETGTAKSTSLYNMQVIDQGTEFEGAIELVKDTDENLLILILALKNLRFVGAKRNRGYGEIYCKWENNEDRYNEVLNKLKNRVI